jgi:hypothetical protein
MTRERQIIKTKIGVFGFAKQLGDTAQACWIKDYGRDNYIPLPRQIR